MADLFDAAREPDRERFLKAGWAEIEYFGVPSWRSPDGKTVLTERLALERLDREELKP